MLKKKNKAGGHTLSSFKTKCKSIVIKMTWDEQKDRHLEQRNRIENPERKPITTVI